MERDFVSVGQYAHAMEAELDRNCLEAAGIRALLTSDSTDPAKPFSLMVARADAASAQACLQGHQEEPLPGTPSGESEDAARQLEEAGREFREIRLAELRHKASGAKAALYRAALAAAASPVLYLALTDKTLAWRAALASLLWAGVELLVWKDGKKAAEEIQRNFKPGQA